MNTVYVVLHLVNNVLGSFASFSPEVIMMMMLMMIAMKMILMMMITHLKTNTPVPYYEVPT